MWKLTLKCLLLFLLWTEVTEGVKFILTDGIQQWPKKERGKVYLFRAYRLDLIPNNITFLMSENTSTQGVPTNKQIDVSIQIYI